MKVCISRIMLMNGRDIGLRSPVSQNKTNGRNLLLLLLLLLLWLHRRVSLFFAFSKLRHRFLWNKCSHVAEIKKYPCPTTAPPPSPPSNSPHSPQERKKYYPNPSDPYPYLASITPPPPPPKITPPPPLSPPFRTPHPTTPIYTLPLPLLRIFPPPFIFRCDELQLLLPGTGMQGMLRCLRGLRGRGLAGPGRGFLQALLRHRSLGISSPRISSTEGGGGGRGALDPWARTLPPLL